MVRVTNQRSDDLSELALDINAEDSQGRTATVALAVGDVTAGAVSADLTLHVPRLSDVVGCGIGWSSK